MGRRNILMLSGAVVFAALVTLLVAGQISKDYCVSCFMHRLHNLQVSEVKI